MGKDREKRKLKQILECIFLEQFEAPLCLEDVFVTRDLRVLRISLIIPVSIFTCSASLVYEQISEERKQLSSTRGRKEILHIVTIGPIVLPNM